MDTYIKTPTGEKGPFTLSQLRTMWAAGTLTRHDEYRDEGLVEWYPLSDLRGELEALADPPSLQPALSAARAQPRFVDGLVRFENPQNGHVEVIDSPGVWVFLFGCFYFAVKGVWTHAIVSLVVACCTVGVSWLIYPFFAKGIMRAHYLRRGWQEISSTVPAPKALSREVEKREATAIKTLLATVAVFGLAMVGYFYFTLRQPAASPPSPAPAESPAAMSAPPLLIEHVPVSMTADKRPVLSPDRRKAPAPASDHPVAAPTDDRPLPVILRERVRWPVEFALTRPLRVPILVNGAVAGESVLEAGQILRASELTDDGRLKTWLGQRLIEVPYEDTDFIGRVAKSRGLP